VYRQWLEANHIVNWILLWKANSLSVSPFNHSCVAVSVSEYDCSYEIQLVITRAFMFLHVFDLLFCALLEICQQMTDID